MQCILKTDKILYKNDIYILTLGLQYLKSEHVAGNSANMDKNTK